MQAFLTYVILYCFISISAARSACQQNIKAGSCQKLTLQKGTHVIGLTITEKEGCRACLQSMRHSSRILSLQSTHSTVSTGASYQMSEGSLNHDLPLIM